MASGMSSSPDQGIGGAGSVSIPQDRRRVRRPGKQVGNRPHLLHLANHAVPERAAHRILFDLVFTICFGSATFAAELRGVEGRVMSPSSHGPPVAWPAAA